MLKYVNIENKIEDALKKSDWFEDGSTGIADLSEYTDDDNVFRQFLDIDYSILNTEP